jgi:hypothetical protein
MATGKRKMNPNSLKNLKTAKEMKQYNKSLTQEERTESARRAGIARQQKARDNRTMKEILLQLLSEPAPEEEIKKFNLPEGSSNNLVIMAAAARKAKDGDIRAGEFVRDTIGQMPTKEVQVSAEVFTEANKALLDKVAERIKKETE